MRNIKLLSVFALVVGSMVFGMLLAEGFDLNLTSKQERSEEAVAAPGATVLAAESEVAPPTSFADVVELVNSAVVFVKVTEIETRSPHPFGGEGQGFWEFFQMPERPEEFRREGGGSGFIIDPEGWILTNNHVIEGASTVTVKLDDDREFEAEVRGTDTLLDVALLKVDSDEPLPVVALGDSEQLRVGDWVLAIGNPFIYEHTVTVGVVSHKGRATGSPFQQFIQTDAAINFGNSGGPLLNTRGEVVGINTAISAVGQNIGFAIPIDMVKEIMDELKAKGKVARGFLGVNPQEIDEKLREAFPGLPSTEGALVVDVEEDSPADEAGILVDDVIIEFDGQPIKERADLFSVVGGTSPGSEVTLKVLREEDKGSGRWKTKVLKTTLVERPESAAGTTEPRQPRERPGRKLGLEVEEITAQARRQLQIEDDVQGVLVVRVLARGGAADAQMTRGDIITQVNGRSVRNVSQFESEVQDVEPGSVVRLRVVHQGTPRYVAVTVGE